MKNERLEALENQKFRASFLKKQIESHIWFNKKGLSSRMTMKTSALQSPDIGGPSRYLE